MRSLAFGDLHWVDPTSLDLLRTLVERSARRSPHSTVSRCGEVSAAVAQVVSGPCESKPSPLRRVEQLLRQSSNGTLRWSARMANRASLSSLLGLSDWPNAWSQISEQ